MPPKREIKDIQLGDAARAKTLAGAYKMYEVVSSTYGPSGNNVILGMPFGDPTVTRDGVTVAKRVILKDKAEDEAAQILRQASEKTNKSAGDGTTATVVLGYHLLAEGHKLIAAGENGMIIKKQINEDSRKVIKYLETEASPATDKLTAVATISAGDPAIGELVSETLADIGNEGGITIREQNYPTVDVEKVNGYLFDKGFFALTQTIEYAQPLVFVTQKQLASNTDMVPLLNYVIQNDNKNLVIIGEVRMNSDAMSTLMLNVLNGKLQAVVVPPPAYGDEGLAFLEDISTYIGSKIFLTGDDMKQIGAEYFGSAERVQVNDKRATIFRGAGSEEDIVARARQIKDQIADETDSHGKDNLEQRYAKLTGKIAIVNVGGSTMAETEELRYRVEDAIEATKSAMSDGVLPGGGSMLVRAADLDISPLFKNALLLTFSKLMRNAAESPEFRMEQIRRAKPGYGFNLRSITKEPVDLNKEAIWDAARAVTQTVENATSAAGMLLTIGAIVDPVEDWDEKTTP